jgi:hypothetical protein
LSDIHCFPERNYQHYTHKNAQVVTDPQTSCNNVVVKPKSRGGFIGGGCTGVRTLLALVDRRAKGVQKNQIQKYGTISKVFLF